MKSTITMIKKNIFQPQALELNYKIHFRRKLQNYFRRNNQLSNTTKYGAIIRFLMKHNKRIKNCKNGSNFIQFLKKY